MTLPLPWVTESMGNGLQIEKIIFQNCSADPKMIGLTLVCTDQLSSPLLLYFLLVWSPGNSLQSLNSSHLPHLPSFPTIETYTCMIALGHIDLNFSFDPNVLSEYFPIPMQINISWN